MKPTTKVPRALITTFPLWKRFGGIIGSLAYLHSTMMKITKKTPNPDNNPIITGWVHG